MNDLDRSRGRPEGWVEEARPIARVPIVSGSVKSGRSSDGSADDDWKRGRRSEPSHREVERPGVGAATAESGGGEFARIGRRGILRPEVAVLVAGALFILAALVKPWPNPSTTPALAARQSTLAAENATAILTAAPTAASTPSPTVDIYALLPPYSYRPGQRPPPSVAATSAPDSAWASVDWSFLRRLDGHSSWGVAVMTLPSQPPEMPPAAPAVSWANEVAPSSPSEIIIPRGSSAFALAITWPSDIRVDSIAFDFLSYDSPRVGVTPVPAAAVATSPPGFPAPEQPATSGPGASSSPARTPDPNGGAMASGAFWIPPSGDLLAPAPQSVKSAWQASPWVWPIGSYRVTLRTNAGEMIVALQLRSL